MCNRHPQTTEEHVTSRLHEIRAHHGRNSDSHQRIRYRIGSRVTVRSISGYVIGYRRHFVYVALVPIFGVPAEKVAVVKR